MKTATVRDLRKNFSKLEAWLADGEEVRIEKRGKPVGYFSARSQEDSERKFVMPDFAARLNQTWGDRIFSEEEVEAMREFELGEQA
jgi:antitoxin (DNA-binding transcriptional repressor) of toxin-antitoxin stability system